MPSYDLLNSAQDAFAAAITAYYPLLLIYGTRILGAVALLGFGVICVRLAWTRSIIGAVEELLGGILKLGLCYAVMANLDTWGNAIVDTGKTIGTQVAGVSPYTLTPSGIYGQGLALVSLLTYSRSFGMWFHLIDDLVNFLLAIIIPLIWLAAALMYFFVLLEALWVIATGPIITGFSALDYTFEMFMRWLWRLLAIAVKIMALLLILAVGMALAIDWASILTGAGLDVNTHRIFYDTLTVAESILFLLCVWFLPNAAMRLVSATGTALGFGEGLLAGAASAASGAASAGASKAASAVGQTAVNAAGAGAEAVGNLAEKVQSMLMR
jgi:P-type conjugative transfer protein TrbL